MKSLSLRFTKKEMLLWISSMLIVGCANAAAPEFDLLILTAALVGVSSLILAAKGNVMAQILMIVFSILYGVISYRFRYWGEMITYLGMTLPMAVWSAVVWFRNPSEDAGVVKIGTMNKCKWIILSVLAIAVTGLFYCILAYFDTPNIMISTLSITTSFYAASLTILRSSYFAVFYAMNDLVLIVLWILAAIEDPVYFPVIINFSIFFVNDIYGFVSWRRRERKN